MKTAHVADPAAMRRHGIHCMDDASVVSRLLPWEGAVIASLEATGAMSVGVDTLTARPERALVGFLETKTLVPTANRGGWVEVPRRSELLVSARGAKGRVHLEDRWRLLVLLVPYEALGAESLLPDGGLQTFTERHSLDQAMQGFIETMLNDTASASPLARHSLEQLLVKMGRSVVLDRSGIAVGSPHEMLRRRAVAVIAQRCENPDLSPAAIARELRCSVRLLQKVFTLIDHTVTGEIRRQRARIAHAWLIDRHFDTVSLDDIGARAGFSSPSAFRRAIITEYGVPPSDLRAHRRRLRGDVAPVHWNVSRSAIRQRTA